MLSIPRFICDDHCGRLARWLRFLGFDSAYERNIDDQSLLRKAIDENRTILTRDRRLVERAMARSLIILESESPLEQLRQVLNEKGLAVEASRIGTRCSVCNDKAEPVTLEDIAERVPPYVRQTQSVFRECVGCKRIFWRGTHVQRMIERLHSAGLIPDPKE
jgi:uncharacterized protein with PIN domain